MDSTSLDHLATTPYSSNPTPGVLLWIISGSQAFWWAIERGGDLELSCSWARCLHQTPFLLSLYLTSLSDLSSPSITSLYLIISLSLSLLLLGLWCSCHKLYLAIFPLILWRFIVSMAPKSPWKDFSIDTNHVSKQSIMAKILGRSTSNHHGTYKGIS